MYVEPPKKMLILNILDVLKRYSDENHRLSAREIGDKLEAEYAQKVDRKSIKRNLMNLINFGYDIEYSEKIRINKNGNEEIIYSDWYLNREFTDAELRLLIDSLLFSKHIPKNQCKELIKKLEDLSNIYFESKVKYIRTMPENILENKALFYSIEVLDEAISMGKRVQFHYISEYGIDKKPRLHKDTNGKTTIFKVNPYQMVASNGRYYLICTNKSYPENIANYRVDRIVEIQMLDDEAITPIQEIPTLKNKFNLSKYMEENIYMFGEESSQVTFRAKKYIIKAVLDWFGMDVNFSNETADEVDISVTVNEQAMLYWALQYGEHIEVLTPKRLREKVATMATKISEKYKK